MDRRSRLAAWLASAWTAATYRHHDEAPVATLQAGFPACTNTAVIDLGVGQAVWCGDDGLFMFVDYPPETAGHTVTVAWENGRRSHFDHMDLVLAADDEEIAQRWNEAYAHKNTQGQAA